MIKTIKKDIVTAMKEKNVVAKDVLRVLMGEVQRGFVTEDVDVIKIVKKMVQNIKENEGSEEEILVLEKYIPKQMTETEITRKVREVINENEIDSMVGMGIIMSHFKNNFDGTYDGRMLSNIVRAELK